MRLIPDPLEFEWDEGNLTKNLKKHNVTLQETEHMFYNRPLLLSDTQPFKSEVRYKALGRSNNNRKLLAVFTVRNNKLRIISVRDMSRKERSEYEKV